MAYTSSQDRAMHALLIVNPVAGDGTATDQAEVLAAGLREAGAEVTQQLTGGAGDARRIAREGSAQGATHLVVLGGDGSVTEAMTGLRDAGRRIPVVQLPQGTANLLAATFAFPRSAEEAVEVLLRGQELVLDLAYVRSHDRCCAISVGAGFDTAVIEGATRQLKKQLGFGAYVLASVDSLRRLERSRITIENDGRRIHLSAHTVMVSNLCLAGNIGIPVGENVLPDDGRLDLLVIAALSPWRIARALWGALLRDFSSPGVLTATGRAFRIEAIPPLPVQIDGDVCGETPIEVEVEPRAAVFLVRAATSPGIEATPLHGADES